MYPRYVSFTLGKLQISCGSNVVQGKAMVGLSGVIIVLFSVACSLGIFSYFKWEATLIVIEVKYTIVLEEMFDHTHMLITNARAS